MMSQITAPSHSYKKPQIYYSTKLSKKMFGNFYLANGMRYIDSDSISERPKKCALKKVTGAVRRRGGGAKM